MNILRYFISLTIVVLLLSLTVAGISYAEVFSTKILTNYTDTNLMANLQTAN